MYLKHWPVQMLGTVVFSQLMFKGTVMKKALTFKEFICNYDLFTTFDSKTISHSNKTHNVICSKL